MRTTPISVRSALTVAAAALPLVMATPAAVAWGSQINVNTSGTTVRVSTTSCTSAGGTASLLAAGQDSRPRQAALSQGATTQTAAFTGVPAGTYTVVVVCRNGTTAGTQSITVNPFSNPTVSGTSSPSPSRGVMGGVGGASKDYRALTYGAGGALVAASIAGTVWHLRRRADRKRL
ncbi:hypothetical protein [Streptomyces cavernae]|uniref:hypothetical protein n=1 Tax=Streptomyces cavernae TaxID=2259034 RepID=UPI0012D8C142|nr:hypothetical protein [Streptomyces cavernae]